MLTEGSLQISTAGFPTSPDRSELSLWWNYWKRAGGAGKSSSRYSCLEDAKLRSPASNKLSLVADLKKSDRPARAGTQPLTAPPRGDPGVQEVGANVLLTLQQGAHAAVTHRGSGQMQQSAADTDCCGFSGWIIQVPFSISHCHIKKNDFPYRSFAQPGLPSTFSALQTCEWDLITTLTQPGLDCQLLTVATFNTCAIFSRCCFTSIYCTLSSIYCAHWIVSAVVLRKQSHVIHAVYAEYTVQGFRNHSS